MKPDAKYTEKQAQMETEKLKQKVAALSPQDKQSIYEKGLDPHSRPAPEPLRGAAAGASMGLGSPP